MYKEKIKVGLMPTRRPIFSLETAKKEYDVIMPVIRGQLSEYVELIDVEDICLEGMGALEEDIQKVVDKFTAAKVDALFFPFCDFGCEEVVVGVAKQFKLPVLIWGSRDVISTYELRGRETQCGIFAATKVLSNYGVTFSYIWNCEADSPDFINGYCKFIRTASVLKALRNLNVAEIGDRPGPFYSVIHNQLSLIQNFNITVKPIPLADIGARTRKVIVENSRELTDYIADFRARIDCTEVPDDYVTKVCAGTMAIEGLMREFGCKCGGFDCGGVRAALELPGSACVIQGELADRGLPTACETDVWGSISQLICTAAALGAETEFLGEWTYRHPTNNNAELIWHGGEFPYSLAAKEPKPKLKKFERRGATQYEAWWELKPGSITMCRVDERDGEFYMFVGEGKTTTGPRVTGTWFWFEVDNWKKWEEHLMFGPFIHHVAGVYGSLTDVLVEAARYLGLHVITPDSPCPKCLG